MPKIYPVSDLRNYGMVLEEVSYGSPVYLTKNGRGAYSIRTMEEEESIQKTEAMLRLLCELNAGIRSGEEKGWLTSEEVSKVLQQHRNEYMKHQLENACTES